MDKKVKKAKAEKPVVVEEVKVEESEHPKSNFNAAKIIWGLLLITIGVLILLGNIGILEVDLWQLWQLWPLLIIVAGISILALRGWLSVAISIIVTVVVLGLAAAVSTGVIKTGGEVTNESFEVVQAHQAVTKANVEIDAGAGSIIVGSQSGNNVVEGSLESNVFKVNRQTSVDDGTQYVKLSLDGNAEWWRGKFSNTLTVNLKKDLPTSLSFNAGASKIKIDLREVVTEALTIDSGASSIDLKLGDKQAVSEVDIDTGVSSVDISVPKNSGIRIVIDGGLSSKNLPSDFEEVSEDTFESANYKDAENKINIVIDMGVSSLKLRTY